MFQLSALISWKQLKRILLLFFFATSFKYPHRESREHSIYVFIYFVVVILLFFSCDQFVPFSLENKQNAWSSNGTFSLWAPCVIRYSNNLFEYLLAHFSLSLNSPSYTIFLCFICVALFFFIQFLLLGCVQFDFWCIYSLARIFISSQ